MMDEDEPHRRVVGKRRRMRRLRQQHLNRPLSQMTATVKDGIESILADIVRNTRNTPN
jgi:hypothetical protein